MNMQTGPEREQSQLPTCEDCAHMIRKNGEQDTVLCVQHLKEMPGKTRLECELHSKKSRGNEGR